MKKIASISIIILLFSFSIHALDLNLVASETPTKYSFKEKSTSIATLLTLVPDVVGISLILAGILPNYRTDAPGISMMTLGGILMTLGPMGTRFYTEDTYWNIAKFPFFKVLSVLFTGVLALAFLSGGGWDGFGQAAIVATIGGAAFLGISIWELIDAPKSADRYNNRKKNIFGNLLFLPIINNETYGAAVSYRF